MSNVADPTPADKVIEIKRKSMGTLQVLKCKTTIILFATPFTANEKQNFQIILEHPAIDSNKSHFSLFRSNERTEVEKKFYVFSRHVPEFMSIVKEYYNVNDLQKLCDTLTENPSWTMAHLMVFFNLVNHVNNPKVLEQIDVTDHIKLMSLFQLAIKNGKIEIVKILQEIGKMEHLDNNSNSVFHYAASTNREIINILTEKSTVNLNHFNSDGYTPLHLACLAVKPECIKALLLAGANVNLSAKEVNNISETPKLTSVAKIFNDHEYDLSIKDIKYGGTPLHWCKSRAAMEAFIASGCDVNAVDFYGFTALHVMVVRERFKCVLELLLHDAEIDVFNNEGNTPLHIAIEKKLVDIVKCLVVFGCNINLKNRKGQTPRHMVGHESNGDRKDQILYILHKVGAKRCLKKINKCGLGCNVNGTYDGIPPPPPKSVDQREHIETMLASTSRQCEFTIKRLKSMGILEEPNEPPIIINTESERQRHSYMDVLMGTAPTKANAANAATNSVAADSTTNSVDSSLDSVSMNSSTCLASSASSTSASNISSTNEGEKPYGRGRLLCLDGGGIRGLVLVQMLLEIEKLSQTPISHMFDWIAGTSTGGILALGLGCGKTIRELKSLYFRMKKTCFVGSRPYETESFENTLRENFGDYTVMTDIKNPKIIVTSVLADRNPVDLHLFRNYESPSEILGIDNPLNSREDPPPAPEDQLIWRAARATSAAPTYFRAYGYILDGGLISNNPTLDAMTEIHEYNMSLKSVGREKEAVPISMVVSLGTGMVPVTELKNVDLFVPGTIPETAKVINALIAIGKVLIDQTTATDGRVVDRARAWCSTTRTPYYRFNPQLSEDIALDEKNDNKLVDMLWCTMAYMYENHEKVVEMINFLK